MNNIPTIEQYLETLQTTKIVEKKRRSPLPSILLMLGGTALLIAVFRLPLPETVDYSLLTAGFIAIATGIALLLRVFDKKSGRYILTATKSPLRFHTFYISPGCKEICSKALAESKFAELLKLEKNNNSLSLLRIAISDDETFALVQLCEYDMGINPVQECAVAKGSTARFVHSFVVQPMA